MSEEPDRPFRKVVPVANAEQQRRQNELLEAILAELQAIRLKLPD
jgi:hypothetical protein